MIISLSTLKQTSERRLPGYLDTVLSIARPLGNDMYELTEEQITELLVYRKTIGLGDLVQGVIHVGLDALPLSPETVKRMKGCGACAKRAARLNAIIPNINPLDQAE